jgi:hypothetical protein
MAPTHGKSEDWTPRRVPASKAAVPQPTEVAAELGECCKVVSDLRRKSKAATAHQVPCSDLTAAAYEAVKALQWLLRDLHVDKRLPLLLAERLVCELDKVGAERSSLLGWAPLLAAGCRAVSQPE